MFSPPPHDPLHDAARAMVCIQQNDSNALVLVDVDRMGFVQRKRDLVGGSRWGWGGGSSGSRAHKEGGLAPSPPIHPLARSLALPRAAGVKQTHTLKSPHARQQEREAACGWGAQGPLSRERRERGPASLSPLPPKRPSGEQTGRAPPSSLLSSLLSPLPASDFQNSLSPPQCPC